jgi:uncharacterized iron-regulated membrane protein
VDDEATSLLMERFYSHLIAGMSKAEAMRQAQLETMVEYPDPYYWAAFVLSGDGGEVIEIPPPTTIITGEVDRTTTSEVKEDTEDVAAQLSFPDQMELYLASGAIILGLILVIGGSIFYIHLKRSRGM